MRLLLATTVATLLLAACEGTVSDAAPTPKPQMPQGPTSPTGPTTPEAPVNQPPRIDGFTCTPASGPAPLTTRCSWQISDPEAKPLRCELDFEGTPAAERVITDCTASGSETHPYATAGGYPVTLTVIDDHGAPATATFSVSVSAPGGNQPPVISAFTAAPAMGLVPLNTTFSWSISDPDNEAMTCELDVGADGSWDYRITACTSASTRGHMFTAGGAVEVVLRVTDARGVQATRRVTVTPIANQAPQIASFTATPAMGLAPLATTLSWSISDGDSDAMRCELDVGADGTFEYTIAACTSASTQAHTLANPATVQVVLKVTDAKGVSATRTLTLTATVNQPPTITTFAATPAAGVAPLATRFGWSIADPEGEAMECQLDVGANGSVEYTLPGCTSSSMQAHTFTAVGAVTVSLKVTDPKGLSSTRTVTVNALAMASAAELRISKVEWGQSVISAAPRLVAEKQALLRIYALADRANVPGVQVTAEAFNGTTSLGSVMLTGPASPPTAEDAASLTTQYRGVVPAAWVATGLEVRVKIDPGNVVTEANENDNALTVTPTIGAAGTTMYLTSVPVIQQGMMPQTPSVDVPMQRIWPVKAVDTQVRAPYTTSLAITSASAGWSSLLSQMQSLRNADGARRYYYGWVKVNYGSGIAGIGYIGQPAATGRDNLVDTTLHELGHNMGRKHAPCGGASGADTAFPYAGAKIGSWGWNFSTNALVSPSTNYDLMSYCSPEWVSDYSYKGVQTFLTSNPPNPAAGTAPDMEFMLVSGIIGPDGLQFQPVQRIFAAAPPPEGGRLTLRMAVHDQIVSVPFDVAEVADLGHEEHHFSLLVPYAGPVRALEVWRGDTLLGRKVAAPVPADDQTLQLTELPDRLELKWDAALWPYAAVAHVGAHQRTTFALAVEGGAASLLTGGPLPKGGELEVSLSDGVNTLRRTFPH